MAEFGTVELHHLEPSVTLNLVEGTLSFADTEKSIKEWTSWTERVNQLLERYKLLPKKASAPTPKLKSRKFIYHNLDTINKLEEGKIKKAPWWVRWAYPQVITNEKLEEVN